MKRFWSALICLSAIAALSSCAGVRMLMQTASGAPKGAPAAPPITALDIQDWEAQRLQIKQQLEKEVYGEIPSGGRADVLSERVISDSAFDGSARVVELSVQLSLDNGAPVTPVPMVLITPAHIDGPVPIILTENFCPNHDVVPIDGLTKPVGRYFNCDQTGFMPSVFGYFFGRYIRTPPITEIMQRGYAIAVVHPPEFVPDRPASGLARLAQLEPDTANRWGAIAAWAWQAQRMVDILDARPEFSDIITYGHSRYGKSALLAAAYDERIDAVISHQSGTGGASISRDKKGETVLQITEKYRHWFTPNYAEDALTIDQHHMLALIAPRPFLLGNAKRDVWSDPDGGFRAAQGANPAYAAYGSDGLTADRLTQFRPHDDIAFWIRRGTHGVVKEDWPAFLEFLDAHFERP